MKLVAPVLSAVLLLAACGSSDGGESGAASSSSGDDVPGLSLEQIGDDDMAVLGSYDIDGSEIEDGVDGPPSAEAQAVFDRYVAVIPEEMRDGVVSFLFIDIEQSDGIDGALQAVIGNDGEPNGQRYIALGRDDPSSLTRTMVHESGHALFTDAAGEINALAEEFNAAFPPGDEYDPELFVTEYAASSPEDGGEDIAESFSMYVLGETDFAGDDDGDGAPDRIDPDTVAGEKVAFFESYDVLVEYRQAILASL